MKQWPTHQSCQTYIWLLNWHLTVEHQVQMSAAWAPAFLSPSTTFQLWVLLISEDQMMSQPHFWFVSKVNMQFYIFGSNWIIKCEWRGSNPTIKIRMKCRHVVNNFKDKHPKLTISPGSSPSQAWPSLSLYRGPGQQYGQAWALVSQAQTRGFRPSPSPHITNVTLSDLEALWALWE